MGDLGWDALWIVSPEGVRAPGKLSRRGVAGASRPHPPPPRMVTRVGGTALQSAFQQRTRDLSAGAGGQTTQTREDEGAHRRRKGKKGLLDSRRRAGAPPPALGFGSLRPTGHQVRASHSVPAPQAHHPDGVALGAPAGGPQASRPHRSQLTSSSATVRMQSPRPLPPPDPRLCPRGRALQP